MRYLDPRHYMGFTKAFRNQPHLIRSFLNSLLPIENSSLIESVEVVPFNQSPQIPLKEYPLLTIQCMDMSGKRFIVVLQMIWTTGFTYHLSFNNSKAYVRQLDRSYEYKSLQPVYALSLVNDIFEPEKEAYYHHYQIVNIEDTGKKLEGLEFVFVELPKFKARNLTEKKLQVLWLRFMTEIDENIAEAPAEFLENKEINEALENLHISGFTKAELETYDKYWDSIRTEKTLHSGFYDKGMAEGKAEGKAEEKKEIARTALAMGMPVQEIARLTGLSEAEIEAL